jgi:hypothetical protein
MQRRRLYDAFDKGFYAGDIGVGLERFEEEIQI